MAGTRDTTAKDVCNVCHDDIEIYAVGKCEHFVCYKCSTRMRLLCEQMYCAICRADLPEVLFMTKYRKYEETVGQFKLFHKKENIYFENEKARSAFLDLLSHKCKLCPLLQPMKTFRELQQHMRRDHSLHYCDICVKDLKVFTAERKFYTREELARHRRLGDVDDKSFKGHPLCELCDQRYLDRDELARHCRKEHYYCHFCESDGLPLVFFGDYSILKDHFKEEHFLCEEGDCIRAQFTNAFRSEIDLKAHKASEHSRHMNKAEIRQARTIEVDFQLAPRRGSNRGRGGRNRGRNRDIAPDRAAGAKYDNVEGDENQDNKDQRTHARYQREQYETAQIVAQHLNEIHRHAGAVAMVDRAILNPVTFEEARQENAASNKQTFSQIPEDFPVLGNRSDESTSASGEEASKTGSSKKDTLAKKLALSSNLSVKDDDMENGDFPSLSGSAGGKKSQSVPYKSAWYTQPKGSDFPALSSKNQSNGRAESSEKRIGARAGSAPVITGNTWVQSSQPSAKAKKSENHSNKQTRVPSDEDFPSLHSIGNMLLNMTPAAPGLSLTKLSSSTSTSTGVGHGQPITSKVPERPNFTTDDFPALGGRKDFSGLPYRQVSSKPKEANYSDAQERKPSKLPRQTGKQPAPMPEFESSASDNTQGKQETEKSEEDAERWEVVRPQKSSHSAVEGKPTNETKSKKRAKKNKKKSSEDKSNKTADVPKSDSDEVTQKLETSSKICQRSGDTMDTDNIAQDQLCKPKRNEDSKGNHGVSDNSKMVSDRVQNTLNDKLKEGQGHDRCLDSSQNKTSPADADKKQTEVNNFPSFSELSETTNILPQLSATDEFPSLPSKKKFVAPPGFSKSKPVSGPPPGFVKPGSCLAASKPPPGFSGPLINDIENIAPLVAGSCSYTSYIEPSNFRSRNEKLISDIREMLSTDKFNEFKSCSGEFRRGHITAKEYYNKCRSIMGSEQFSTILPELISLLPDIERQQELLAVYSDDETKLHDVVQIKQKRKPAWKSQTMLLAPCTICRQVVLSSELNEHVSKHDIYMDFPTLSSISASLIHH